MGKENLSNETMNSPMSIGESFVFTMRKKRPMSVGQILFSPVLDDNGRFFLFEGCAIVEDVQRIDESGIERIKAKVIQGIEQTPPPSLMGLVEAFAKAARPKRCDCEFQHVPHCQAMDFKRTLLALKERVREVEESKGREGYPLYLCESDEVAEHVFGRCRPICDICAGKEGA